MNRLKLILEVLDFNRPALQILSDIIEEEGDAGLAEKTRMRKFDLRKMLHLGLELIPHQMSLQVGTDFFRHAMSYGKPHPELVACWESVERWIAEVEVDPEQCPEGLEDDFAKTSVVLKDLDPRAVQVVVTGFRRAWDSFESGFAKLVKHYVEALRFANDLVQFQREVIAVKLASRNNALRTQIQSVASCCRTFPRQINTLNQRAGGRWRREPYTTELLQWQMEHLKGAIEAAV